MPNLSISGTRIRTVDKTSSTKLRLAYDKYLSSLEAKYVFENAERNINSNLNEQKDVFREEFVTIKKQLLSLIDDLESMDAFKMEKNILDKKFEIIQMLCE